MKHIMHLNDFIFYRMKDGLKKREYRVNDEKRKQVRVGDVIEFHNNSNDDIILMDVLKIETFSSLDEAVEKYFDEDFEGRYKDTKSVVDAYYDNGFIDPQEIREFGIVVFELKKSRVVHYNATACYLKKDDKVLMIKFNKKWGCVYAPPGGNLKVVKHLLIV